MAEPCDSAGAVTACCFLLVMSYCQLGYPRFRLELFLLTIAEMQATNAYGRGTRGKWILAH